MKMKCEDLQLNLSIYLDDILTGGEREIVEKHLAQCPLCRQKLAGFQNLRVSLRSLPRPALSADNLAAMRIRVAHEANSPTRRWLFISGDFAEWLERYALPYSVGTAFSLIFSTLLLWTLFSAAYIPAKNVELAKLDAPVRQTVLLTNTNAPAFSVEPAINFDVNPAEYAAARLTVSGGSPSLNPHGALVALTRSIVRGNMKDDEVVIVADVFGDGLAQIAEVVEPSSDIRAVSELEKALKNDPNYAPFVPASFDKRSETVRVIFKINRVDIKTNTKSKSR